MSTSNRRTVCLVDRLEGVIVLLQQLEMISPALSDLAVICDPA